MKKKTNTKLTEKQEVFALAVFSGKSSRDAYKEAYPNNTMKMTTIDQAASRLLKSSKIKRRLRELRSGAEVSTEILDAMTMRKFLIENHMKIIGTNPLDYLQAGVDPLGNPIYTLTEDLQKKDGHSIKDIKMNSNGIVVGVTFYDKQHSLDALERLYGLDEQEEEKNDAITVNILPELEDYAD